MATESIVPILSAAGIGGGIVGGIVTSFIQSWLSRRAVLDERQFREKKEAYAGLLNAIYSVTSEHSPANVKEAGYWRARCDLVGSDQVRLLRKRLFDLADGTQNPDVLLVEAKLLTAMRADLGFAARAQD